MVGRGMCMDCVFGGGGVEEEEETAKSKMKDKDMQNRVSVWKEIREKKNKSDTQQNGGKNEGGDGSRFLRLFCCQNDRRKSLFSYNFSKLFFFMFYYSTTKTTRKNLLRHPSPPGERDSERDVRGKKETVMNSKFKKKYLFSTI